jgi:hypothetical protein
MEDKFYCEVSDSMKMMYDLTSRIDERVKNLVETYSDLNDRIDKLIERQESITSRISILENKNGVYKDISVLTADVKELQQGMKLFNQLQQKVAVMEVLTLNYTDKWKNLISIAFNIIVIVIGGIILWKLGIRP